MFFKPQIDRATVTPETRPYELYSDLHKQAFGCRPRREQPSDMTDLAVELETLDAWDLERQRINKLRHEVARFDLSRSLEYIVRRGDAETPQQAFYLYMLGRSQIDLTDRDQVDWEYICYVLDLPYEDAPRLKEFWEEGK